jgi:hypothetical protein
MNSHATGRRSGRAYGAFARNAHCTWSRSLMLGFGLASFAASAAEGPIALHPMIVVDATDADAEGFRHTLAEEVARHQLDVVAGERVTAFLASRSGSCAAEESCLAELAKVTGAARTLLITLAPYSPRIVVSGKVVNSAGAVRTNTREFPKAGGLAQAVRHALRKFLEELDVDLTAPLVTPLTAEPASVQSPPQQAHPPEPPPQVAAPAPVPAPEATKPVEPTGPMSNWRIASFACLGVAAAAAISAEVVNATSGPDGVQLTSIMDPYLELPAGNAQAAELQRSLKQRSNIATGLVVTAIIAGTAGGALYLFAPATKAHVGVVADGHGAGVSVGASF